MSERLLTDLKDFGVFFLLPILGVGIVGWAFIGLGYATGLLN